MSTLEQIGLVLGFIAFGGICWGIFRFLQNKWIEKKHREEEGK